MIETHRQIYKDKATIDTISREKDPERFQAAVDDKYGALVPAVKDYSHGLYVPFATLDSSKLGATLISILEKKKNVSLLTNAEVVECTHQRSTGIVTSVKTTKGNIIPCDVLVLS